MSGSLGLNALAMPGIGPTAPTNALAPAMPAPQPAGAQFDPVAAQQWLMSQQPVGGIAAQPGQTGQQTQQLTPQQQFAALMQYYQLQQAAQSQQQAAQAKALQDQQQMQAAMANRGPSGNEGGAGGSADHGGADTGVI